MKVIDKNELQAGKGGTGNQPRQIVLRPLYLVAHQEAMQQSSWTLPPDFINRGDSFLGIKQTQTCWVEDGIYHPKII